jgi:hypothetical protein
MGFGALLDFAEHGFVSHASDVVVAGFPLAEHAAHLIVLMGMIAVLAGIVVDGVRLNHRRNPRHERSAPHAHR